MSTPDQTGLTPGPAPRRAPANVSAAGGTPVPGWLAGLVGAVGAGIPVQVRQPGANRPGGRQAAVLILFGEGPDGPDVLLLKRAADLRNHAGQPAFPGGSADETDVSRAATALREAEEEVGLDPSGVEILATVSPLYLAASHFHVTPVLAWWHTPSAVVAVDPAETSSVARVPVAELADPGNRILLRHPAGFGSPAFRVRGMTVWGFTAGILDALLRAGGWERPWDTATPVDVPEITAAISKAMALPRAVVEPRISPDEAGGTVGG
ncbi:NUDIX domain-containing protein [Parafrankia irregularis]|uniref:NUDIX domain-containing protein n=1 Tax=Parafrankia irregularis TaxID=795642 RepID=A0A0S4QSE6_9ACTN|nr:CoA pyrophosphatase [Parafrankia irregularis]CUU58419.1 NUDIX domain-containing protein [Parafrankia irregularis]